MLFEEENETYENPESSESVPEYNPETYENTDSCTYVITENYEVVCLEQLIAAYQSPDTETEIESEDNAAEDIEEKIDKEGETVLESSPDPSASPDPTASPSPSPSPDPIYHLLSDWHTEYFSQLLVVNKFHEDVDKLLNDIYSYIDLFIGLWFIAWIFSQLNSWRRNNK